MFDGNIILLWFFRDRVIGEENRIPLFLITLWHLQKLANEGVCGTAWMISDMGWRGPVRNTLHWRPRAAWEPTDCVRASQEPLQPVFNAEPPVTKMPTFDSSAADHRGAR